MSLARIAAGSVDEAQADRVRSVVAMAPEPESALIYNHMVVELVDGELSEVAANHLFRALADVTRRDILRRSSVAGVSVSRLAAAYPVSFAAIQKHVAVLQRAGLVTKERRGREHLVRTDPGAFELARRALDRLEDQGRGRVERMSSLLAADREAIGNPPTGPDG